MDVINGLLSFYYGFIFASVISFARLFTNRCQLAFYEKSRKKIIHKWKFILSGRSRCDHCSEIIPVLYLVPVFGYLFALGKCTNCHNKISLIYFLEESMAFVYGSAYFIFARFQYLHYHISVWFMILYFFLCYFISRMDYRYFLIPTGAIVSILFLAVLELVFVIKPDHLLLISVIPLTWFCFLYLLGYAFPEKLGMADIHFIPVLCLAIHFPHSLYLPAVASFIAIIYFFLRYRHEKWKDSRHNKIPFGVFLSLAFLLLKIIP